jgi:hypothetical protein
VKEEVARGTSVRAIAKLLGTDSKTVKKNLGLNSSLQNVKISGKIIESFRAKWKRLINRFSISKIKKARELSPKIYAWLYRNDKQWLAAFNKRSSVKVRSVRTRLDWQKRDAEISESLAIKFDELKNLNFRKRLSKTLLATLVGNQQYYLLRSKFAHRLPKSLSILLNRAETVADYQNRRFAMALDHFQSNPLCAVTFSNVMRYAGLRHLSSEQMRLLKTL